jgi:hypothetical protein
LIVLNLWTGCERFLALPRERRSAICFGQGGLLAQTESDRHFGRIAFEAQEKIEIGSTEPL